MTKTNNLLVGLNVNQKEAVTSIKGPIQVNSVAGSGKTRVLTHRIAYMIKTKKIDPSKILVATFTKKAAQEMEERLQDLLTKDQLKKLTLGTFHSIGYKILRQEYKLLNHKLKDFKLLSGNPQKWMMEEIIEDLKLKKFNDQLGSIILSEISHYKTSLISPDALEGYNMFRDTKTDFDDDVVKAYREYEIRKTKKHLIDFDDMIYKLYLLLINNKEILKKYQDQFEYILVDEAQDNNTAQYTIIEMLGLPQNNIFIVGDDDQSIYGFRDAAPEKFIQFSQNYKGVKVVNLLENYRSLPYILNAANKLIKNNTVRVQKHLVPFKKGNNNDKIDFKVLQSEDKESEYISNEILKFSKKRKFNDMTVIYRTNAQSRALEDALIVNAIPYTIINGISFYERAEVKDILCYIRLGINPHDNEAFLRVINKPSRFLGKVFIESLEKESKKYSISLFSALKKIKLTYNQSKSISQFTGIVNDIADYIDSCGTKNLIDYIIKLTEYDKYLAKEGCDEEDNVRLENLKSLQKIADKYTAKTLIDYVNRVINNIDNNDGDTVKLMTLHKSKGLEFPVVFMCGMNSGLLPHKNAIEDGNIEEERRLAYVGITRAKEILCMTSTQTYQNQPYTISPFIEELELLAK